MPTKTLILISVFIVSILGMSVLLTNKKPATPSLSTTPTPYPSTTVPSPTPFPVNITSKPTLKPKPTVTPTATPKPASTNASSNSDSSTVQTLSSPTATSIPSPSSTPIPPIVSISTNNVSVTFSKAASTPGQYMYGPGFTMTYQPGLSAYGMDRHNAPAEQGFYESTGGLNPAFGGSETFHTFINPFSIPVGTYNSTYTLKYTKSGIVYDAANITLTITVTD